MDGNCRRLDFDSDILNSDLISIYIMGYYSTLNFGMNVNVN